MHRAHRIRLNPTPAQEAYFWRCAGIARFSWNWALAEYNAALARGEKPNLNALKVEFTRRRREEGFAPFVAEVQWAAHQYAFMDLRAAINRYHEFRQAGRLQPPPGFKPRKDGKPYGWPRFKSRQTATPAFGIANETNFRCIGHNAYIPRCPDNPVNMAEELRFAGRILSGRVSYSAGHWFLAVAVELPDPQPDPLPGVVGVDLGIKSLAVTSDGVVYPNPKHLLAAQRKLARLQRERDRRAKGGKNRVKTVAKLARLHARIANQRREALHEMTTDLVSHYGTVVVEDLNVAGMVRNHHLARSVSDAGFGEIRRQLEYKAPAFGSRIVVADRFFPSSKTCNACGGKVELTLADRAWTCPHCGAVHDRDLNAARNLRDLAGSG
jgi:putative transposase